MQWVSQGEACGAASSDPAFGPRTNLSPFRAPPWLCQQRTRPEALVGLSHRTRSAPCSLVLPRAPQVLERHRAQEHHSQALPAWAGLSLSRTDDALLLAEGLLGTVQKRMRPVHGSEEAMPPAGCRGTPGSFRPRAGGTVTGGPAPPPYSSGPRQRG